MWVSCIVEEMFWWFGALVLFWVRKYHRAEHRELVILPPWCFHILFLAEEVSPSPAPGTGNTPTLPWHPSCEELMAPCTPLYFIGCTVMVGWIDKSIDSWTFLMRIASSTLRRIVGQDLRSSHLPLCSSLCQRLVYESYARGRQEEHQSNGFLLLAAQPVHSAYKTELDFLLGFLPLADRLAGLTSFSYPCFLSRHNL